VTAASAGSPDKLLSTPAQQQPNVQRSNFEDWVVNDNEDDFYYQDARPRNNRRKKNKKNKREPAWEWDDIYDPTRPNNYADYKRSEEQTREIRDWKARLYYHQLKEARKANQKGMASDNETAGRPSATANRMYIGVLKSRCSNISAAMFAPPANLNFAPPSFDDAPTRPMDIDDDDYYPPARPSFALPTSNTQPSAPDDATGDDAYRRRMQMSSFQQSQSASPPAMPPALPNAISNATDAETDRANKIAAAQAKIAAFKAKHQKPLAKPDLPAVTQDIPPPPPPPPAEERTPAELVTTAAPAPQSGSTIFRAPVRYELPPAPANLAAVDEDVPMPDADNEGSPSATEELTRSNRPGQKGFAERLLKKYGWEKGQGLGAQGEGITTAIVAKADKRKKLSDAQGGGWAAPANMGKIVGGKKRKVEGPEDETDPRFGKMSEVIKLESMLDGLDVQKEIEDNNLLQEIGDEMGSKYGNVERVFVWREEMGGKNEVFVKFNSMMSSMRAVNAMSGTTFAGNEVVAKYWDAEMFEKGEYA
jgi:splicing factor 45